jgi:CheY-like chemotaxis protein
MAEAEPVLLLTEDNPDHAELVLRCLEGYPIPHRVIHLTDGAAALAYLTRQFPFADPADAPTPHLVLLDLRLPKIDGLDILRAVKASPALSRIPVVVLSSSAAEADVTRAYAAHANSYLVKPTDFDRLRQMIDDLGRYWLRWNQPPT